MSLEIPEATDAAVCPVCEDNQGIVVGTKGRFGMPVRNVCCAGCACVYVSPRPGPEAMAEYYRSTYRKHYGGVGYLLATGQRVAPGEPGFEQAMAGWHDNQASRAIALARTERGARVLEIGCRHGKTLSIMKERLGIVPFGIEPGEDEAEQARRAGVDCFTGQLEAFAPSTELFQQVQLFHVLEHVHDPLAALLKLRSLLKPGGTLLVEVPNAYQPYGLLEENFFQNVHLVTYSPNTLPALLKRAGFDVLEVVDDTSLSVVARPTMHLDEQALPLPFSAELLSAREQDSVWLATRLKTYANLEMIKLISRQRGFDAGLVAALVESLKHPSFVAHMVDSCADFIEQLAGRGMLDDALGVTLAVADGPHPREIRQEFRGFAERMGVPAGQPAPA